MLHYVGCHVNIFQVDEEAGHSSTLVETENAEKEKRNCLTISV